MLGIVIKSLYHMWVVIILSLFTPIELFLSLHVLIGTIFVSYGLWKKNANMDRKRKLYLIYMLNTFSLSKYKIKDVVSIKP